MSLFTQDLIDSYKNNSKIQQALNGVILLTFEEFKDWYSPSQSMRSSRIEKNTIKGIGKERVDLQRQNSIEKRQVFIDTKVITDLADIVCQGQIGLDYGQHTVKQLIDKNKDFDTLIAVDSTYNTEKDIFNPETVLTHKLKHVVGFIIAELSECKDKLDVYSVNLICTRKVREVSIKSIILLGAFIYCIKNCISKINNNEGILELAGGYTNMAGFISYTKMGFNKNLNLSSRNCFRDYSNLPMSVNISIN